MNAIFGSSSWAVFEARPSPTLAKIDSFASLPVGWDYGQGVPASAATVSCARDLYYELTQLGFTRTEAFPGTGGGIQLTAYEGHLQHIIVITKPSGEISLTHKLDGQRTEPAIVSADRNVVKTRLREIAREKWNISVSSTQSSLTTHGGCYSEIAFANHETDGNASVIDKSCVESEGRSYCKHIKKFYSRHISGDPSVFWIFDESILPVGSRLDLELRPVAIQKTNVIVIL